MYYPSGGMSDCDGDFDTVKEIQEYIKTQEYKCDYYEVIDLETGEEINLGL